MWFTIEIISPKAASFEQKCQGKVEQLLETQNKLLEQIQILEQKEKEGVELQKQAECLWSCMEEAYKKKIAESLERQNELLKQVRFTAFFKFKQMIPNLRLL